MDHLLKHCLNLKELYIHRSTIHTCRPSTNQAFTNTSITGLTLEWVQLHVSVAPELSVRLPSLSIFRLMYCSFNDNKEDTMSNAYTGIQSSTLKNLVLKYSFMDAVNDNAYPTEILVKLSTMKGTKYYKRKTHGTFNFVQPQPYCFHVEAQESSELEYIQGLEDKNCATMILNAN
jgi:hypothetical protein